MFAFPFIDKLFRYIVNHRLLRTVTPYYRTLTSIVKNSHKKYKHNIAYYIDIHSGHM